MTTIDTPINSNLFFDHDYPTPIYCRIYIGLSPDEGFRYFSTACCNFRLVRFLNIRRGANHFDRFTKSKNQSIELESHMNSELDDYTAIRQCFKYFLRMYG